MTRVPGDRDFRWLFDASVEAMLLADVNGAILARNLSCERIFGYAGEEWAGLSIEDLLPERFRAAHRHYRAAYATKPQARPMGRGGLLAGLRKDGSEFPAQVSLSVLPGTGAGNPLILAIVEDLTSLRSAEEALLRNASQLSHREAMLGLAVRSMGLAAWEWSPWSDAVYLSPEWKAQLGYADEEMANHAAEWRSRFHPDDVGVITALVAEFTAGKRKEGEAKYRLRHRDGGYRWMLTRAVLLQGAEGDGKRLMGLQWDVTEQTLMAGRVGEWHAEEARQRQLLVALETAAAIAHELNQPLNAMVSFSEAAQLMARQGKLDKLDYALASAVTQAARAGQVVRDLLCYLEQHQMPTESLDLKRVVEEAVDLAIADEARGCRISLAPSAQLPPVQGNEIQIKKALINLLRNAAEAMDRANTGERRILVSVGAAEEPTMAQVSVKDAGPGPDPVVAEHIFEPFFTTKPQGIGMGLATSRRMIERLGGRLWFDPATEGPIFHFTIPFAP